MYPSSPAGRDREAPNVSYLESQWESSSTQETCYDTALPPPKDPHARLPLALSSLPISCPLLHQALKEKNPFPKGPEMKTMSSHPCAYRFRARGGKGRGMGQVFPAVCY